MIKPQHALKRVKSFAKLGSSCTAYGQLYMRYTCMVLVFYCIYMSIWLDIECSSCITDNFVAQSHGRSSWVTPRSHAINRKHTNSQKSLSCEIWSLHLYNTPHCRYSIVALSHNIFVYASALIFSASSSSLSHPKSPCEFENCQDVAVASVKHQNCTVTVRVTTHTALYK